MSSLPQAIQIMLDPADCGPAIISLSQDVQGEAFDYPEVFFEEKIHEIRRIHPDPRQIERAAEQIKKSKQPIGKLFIFLLVILLLPIIFNFNHF